MNYIEEVMKKEIQILKNVQILVNHAFTQIYITIRQNQDKFIVNMGVEDCVNHKVFPGSEVEFFAFEDELMELLNCVYNYDIPVIVAAPTKMLCHSCTSIIGVNTQISFDDATRYPELIDSANSQALFKDGMTNSNRLITGSTYQCWKVFDVTDFIFTEELMFILQKCILLLDVKTGSIELNSWLNTRVVNREDNVDNYLITYNADENNYFVKQDNEKIKVNGNKHLYN